MKFGLTTGAALAATMLCGATASAEQFSFTVVAGHPPITKGVSNIRDFFIPEVNRRLAETGAHSIEWTEAYAGSMSGERMFRAEVDVVLPVDLAAHELAQELERLAGDMMAEITFADVG